jgi:acyl-CoA thioesterase I
VRKFLFNKLSVACHSQVQGFVLIVLMFFSLSAIAQTPQKTLLVMGDSLSAAYNLPTQQGWVALTAATMKTSHPNWKVVNASISGETTAGGLSRFPAALKLHKPHLVIIELGANDGLRGFPLAQTRKNLLQMIQLAKKNQAKVLLIGIQIPPNYGNTYTQGFSAIYSDLSKQEKTHLLPFLLAPIATDRKYFQADQLHPTAQGQIKIREHVWTALKPLL